MKLQQKGGKYFRTFFISFLQDLVPKKSSQQILLVYIFIPCWNSIVCLAYSYSWYLYNTLFSSSTSLGIHQIFITISFLKNINLCWRRIDCYINFRCTVIYIVHQSDSLIHIHVSIFIPFIFLFRLLQSIKWRSMYYKVGPCWLSILTIACCTSNFFFFFLLLSLWDLSSLTSGWTQATTVKARNPNHQTTKGFSITKWVLISLISK